MKPNLGVEIAGLKLRNPTMLAAGILGLSGSTFRRVWEAGAGAVVTKSLGLRPRQGYTNPTIVDTGFGLVNAMGLPNPGVEEYVGEVYEARKGAQDMTIIASIFGGSPNEFSRAAEIMEKAGVDGLELNVSCPHVKTVGMEVGQDPSLLERVVRSVKEIVEIPVFTKLTPNYSNIQELACSVERAGGDGVVAINTLRAMTIDVETGRPILSNKIGGLSGPAIKPVAIRCVYEIAQSVDIPVIGCGGVMGWKDCIEYLLAGAQAIQIGSAIAYKDLEIFNEVILGVEEYLKRKEVKRIGEIIGLSHKD